MSEPLEILVVDDDPGDTMLICDALADTAPAHRIATAAGGAQGLEHLRAHPHTDLVLLDVSMPGMNGHEVLAAIKADDTLRHIPVVVFTSSTAPADILNIYRQHGSAYVTKPIELDQFSRVIAQISHFYEHVALLPRPC